VVLWNLKKDSMEIKGFGTYSLASVNEWGTELLRYATITAIVAGVLLPIRFAFFSSGVMLGGVAMIALGEGRDVSDLAEMDESLPPLKEMIEILPPGYHLMWGLGLCVALIVVGTLARMTVCLIEFRSFLKEGRAKKLRRA
jgi:hypothetical protein